MVTLRLRSDKLRDLRRVQRGALAQVVAADEEVDRLRVTATCVRVPVVTTHSVAVHARFAREVTREQAWETLSTAPGVVLCDDPAKGEFPTPADVVGTDPTWVGRLRRSIDNPHALDLFVCGDNLRKGAALNTAQIAELLAAEFTGG